MKYKIPLFDLHYGKAEEDAVIRVLRKKWISMGDRTQAFEEAFAQHLRVKHVVAVSSCTAALHMALLVLGIEPGDEVIVPSLTFVATANAARYMKAKPVFADVKSVTDLSLDPQDVERKMTAKTRAIIVMHYGGYSADMDALRKIARQHNVGLVEDAAHAPDAEYNGRKLGTFGDVGCFSFFSNKNITCAEGGAFVTNNPDYAKKARFLRSHGMTSLSYDRAKGHAVYYDVTGLGYNYRIDDIRSALLVTQLRRLKKDIDKRKTLVYEYRRLLSDTDAITVPYERHPFPASYYIMPIIINGSKVRVNRDEIRRRMTLEGIQTSIHYNPVHKFRAYRQYHCQLPVTENVGINEITLPLYYGLTLGKVAKIVHTLQSALK
jgi:dTDP-4-amino-4,6-dideoxygalactose transaminase